jgi:hypothetical protein
MRQIAHFVAGRPAEGQGEEVLSRLRWPIPAGVIEAYVGAYTKPGDRVVVPFCQGAGEVGEIVRLGRQVLALHYDPVPLLVAQAALSPVSTRELDAAVARLGDSLKQETPLRRYLEAPYATTCPACLRPVTADYFIWEQGKPIAKQVRCPVCDWDGQTGIDPADQERLAEIPARGMAYHYVLDRVAPQPESDALRSRLEPLLDLYTPRNLDALADLTRRIEALFAGGPLYRVLLALLLDCLDRCSALAPLPGSSARRRGLTRPARFVERNVWRTFEEAAGRFQTQSGPALADSLERYKSEQGEEWAGLVGKGVVRDLPRLAPAHSLPLVLVSPPPLDSAAWTLSYLWGAWLLGSEAVAPLRPLLRQRTPDPVWYARVMAGSFRTMADLLSADGRMLLVLSGPRPAILEALLWAATRAGLRLTCLVQSGADYRLELAAAPAPVPVSGLVQEAQVKQAALQAIAETIQARGEPTPGPILHAAVYQRLAETGLLAPAPRQGGEEAAGLEAIDEWVKGVWDDPRLARLAGEEEGEELWWLASPSDVARPLADRVEAAAYAVLQEDPVLDEVDFANRVYAHFSGSLTPDAELIAACLGSYGYQTSPGRWELRPEDQPEMREAERGEITARLLELGQRLGYQARRWDRFDMAWFEGKQVRAVFVVSWQAVVSEVLALGQQARGANLHLVIPGGRAALASYKLARNPLWQQMLDDAGWRFIKYRHVRQLAAQPEVDEYALRAIVGLDPIVEREVMQIPLF